MNRAVMSVWRARFSRQRESPRFVSGHRYYRCRKSFRFNRPFRGCRCDLDFSAGLLDATYEGNYGSERTGLTIGVGEEELCVEVVPCVGLP